jgi:hypothetical protein
MVENLQETHSIVNIGILIMMISNLGIKKIMKILVKITNGKKTYIEDVTDSMTEANKDWQEDMSFFRPVKCKLSNIGDFNNKENGNFIYGWIEGFMQSDDVPQWIWESDDLDIYVINKV